MNLFKRASQHIKCRKHDYSSKKKRLDVIQKNTMLLLMPYLPPPVCGGSGVFIREIFKRFPKGEVTALVGLRDQKEGTFIDGNMTVHRLKKLFLPLKGFSKSGKLKYILSYIKEVLIFNQNRVFSYCVCGEYFPGGFAALLLNLFYGVPYFIVFHGEDIYKISGLRKELLKVIIFFAKGFIANSENTKRLIERFNMRRPIFVCRPCVDHNLYIPCSNIELVRKDLGLTSEKIILTVARLLPRKGHKFAISALKEIIKKYPDTNLIIIGQDFGYSDAIYDFIDKCELHDKVFLKGAVSDEELVKYYQASDVFVMVSDTGTYHDDLEGFGITFLEASACEKPVIAGNTGGMPEAVEDGVTGFLVDHNNLNKFSSIIQNLLENPQESTKIGKAGRARVLKSFDYNDRSLQIRNQLIGLLSQ